MNGGRNVEGSSYVGNVMLNTYKKMAGCVRDAPHVGTNVGTLVTKIAATALTILWCQRTWWITVGRGSQ